MLILVNFPIIKNTLLKTRVLQKVPGWEETIL